MSSIIEIKHKNLIIHYTDLSGRSIEEASVVMDEAVTLITQLPLKSVYSIVNVKDAKFDKGLIDKLKVVGRKNEPFVKATAIFGLNAMTLLMAKAAVKLTGRRARLCDSLEESKEWLYQVSQREFQD